MFDNFFSNIIQSTWSSPKLTFSIIRYTNCSVALTTVMAAFSLSKITVSAAVASYSKRFDISLNIFL
jgi:hypothetical protein